MSTKTQKEDYKFNGVITRLMGSGAYSEVYCIMYKGEKKVIKKTRYSRYNPYYGIEFPLEIDIMSRIRHPNLMYAEEIVEDNSSSTLNIIMPYMPKTLLNIKNLNLYDRVSILFRIICAVRHLYIECNIMHLDIKPANILLDEDNNPYLTDFGMALLVDDPKCTITITKEVIPIHFRPYELYSDTKEKIVGEHTLVWQLGMLILFGLVEIYIPCDNEAEAKLYLKKYFSTETCPMQPFHSLRHYFSKVITDGKILDNVVDLVAKMLNPDYEDRYTIDSTLEHPFWEIVMKNKPVIVPGTVINTDIKEENKFDCDVNAEKLYKYNKDILKIFNLTNIPSAIFYFALDILYRSVFLIKGENEKTLTTHVIACNMIGWKFFYFRLQRDLLNYYSNIEVMFIRDNSDARKFEITISDVIEMEKRIIFGLEGRLYRRYIFDYSSSGDLVTRFRNIFDSVWYHNFAKIISKMPGTGIASTRPNLETLIDMKII